MFKNNTKNIRKRVMAVIDEKIKSAQQAYDEEEKVLVENFEKEIKERGEQLERDKVHALSVHVDAIIGKIL